MASDMMRYSDLHVVALAGGVGGARLAQGLAALLPPSALSIIVNSGDDFEYLNLSICPDLDTVLYTLAGLGNPASGWGLAGDTSACLDALQRLGGPTWFHLGDRDLATHLLRTTLLNQGLRLTEVTHRIATALGVQHPILPMCDTPLRTMVKTDEGEMAFQEYFVHRAWQPRLLGLRWEGLEKARPTPEVLAALAAANLVIFCPSNPFVSIDPILLLPGVRETIHSNTVVALSPIIGGQAVKGPAAKMFRELNIEPSALAVAEHYRNLLSGYILDTVDEELLPHVQALGMAATAVPSLMPGLEERISVAHSVLDFALQLLQEGAGGRK
jgi:LPPG:FO 2-phospho-L-lactate transferase